MKFQIISHAGLLVRAFGVNLLFDPWILGSVYWRSWWNYPPVSPALIASLKPDFIYLTHIHWDHFQGPSLRSFSKSTTILVPRGPTEKMKRDLNRMGFLDVKEINHGESLLLASGFQLTSYQLGHFLVDSAVVLEGEGVTLLNINDGKFMGGPLQQILKRHPKIDFVFCSHSSANSRLCFEMMGDGSRPVDDPRTYVEWFSNLTRATGARYAIPFASNHCYLHKDVYHFNPFVTTPQMVKNYFDQNLIVSPVVQVMVSGDSWSSESGFEIAETDYFENREERLAEYQKSKEAKLEKFYQLEERALISVEEVERFFLKLFRATPLVLRVCLKGQRFTFVLTAGDRRFIYEADFYRQEVRELDRLSDEENSIQIHTSVHIMKHCMAVNLFGHLGISKRVKFRVEPKRKKYLDLLIHILGMYEYEFLPLRNCFRWRFIRSWGLRWREVVLYLNIIVGLIFGRRFDMKRYLPIKEVPLPRIFPQNARAPERVKALK